jgi:hypothetical protein
MTRLGAKRQRLALFGGAAILAVGLAISARVATATPRTAGKHRWETCGGRSICATEDGGRHWRVVFQVPASVSTDPADGRQILDYLRWSKTAGVVSVDTTSHLSASHRELWTRDGGKHWWPTAVFDVGFGGVCSTSEGLHTCVHRVRLHRGWASDAPALFFEVEGQVITPRPNDPPDVEPLQGTNLLRGWVPVGHLSCSGKWLGKPGRQICWGAPVHDGMSASPR